ncbi:MAG: LLM class flavin-dependent oxidoreductase [Salinirussus sp.]
MKYGTGYLRETYEQTYAEASLADRYGYDLFGVADSQALGHELHTTLGALARETESVAIGSTITNAITRHPVVTASAMATVNHLSGGRAFMGFGSGDSAVYTLGERPATLGELETTIRHIKTLWRGETIELDGKPVELQWIDPDDPPDIPVLLAAEGPKTLELAGRVADGAIMGLGITPEVREASLAAVRRGARAAGRDPSEIETWLFLEGNIDDDGEHAVDQILQSLAGAAHHSLQFTFEGKAVPEEHRDALWELVDRYDSDAHQSGEGSNVALVEELGLREYLTRRYAIAGTRDHCRDRLEELQTAGDVDGLLFAEHSDTEPSFLEWFGEEFLHEDV